MTKEKCILIMSCVYLLSHGSDDANDRLDEILKPYEDRVYEDKKEIVSKMENAILEIVEEGVGQVYGVPESKRTMLN